MFIYSLVAISSATTSALSAQNLGGGVKGWIAAGALAMVMPFVYAWAKRKVYTMIANWALNWIKKALEGGGIQNGDLKLMVHNCMMELVKFSEKKLPESGMGAQKMDLVLSLLEKAPFIGPWFKVPKNRDLTKEVIEECVKQLDAGLHDIEQKDQAPKQ